MARRLPRLRFLETMGAASLPVFCAHIAMALFTLAFFGSTQVVRPWTTDVALLAAAFAGLFLVALGVQAHEQRGRRRAQSVHGNLHPHAGPTV